MNAPVVTPGKRRSSVIKRVACAIAGLLGVWCLLWQVAAKWPVSAPTPVSTTSPPPLMTQLDIAPRSEALTFARYRQDETIRVMLVTSFAEGKVKGINLQTDLPSELTDPISIFNRMGYAALEEINGEQISVDVHSLQIPFDGTDNQIAVGINYPAHADETAVRDSFLFPKRTTATSHLADVQARDHLLDYEIELGFVLLSDLRHGEMPDHVGLVLSSDYTDRAALIRNANLFDVSSGHGFTTGKSDVGFMPTGNLFVIPKDYASFYRSLKLQLWHNGTLRQEARPRELIWDVKRVVEESFARSDRVWLWQGKPVALPVNAGVIPARTMLLSGTPGGVIYQQPTTRQIFVGLSELFFSLNWSHPQSVIEPFVREAYRSGIYLKPGDLVQMRADRLGTISNRIVRSL